MVREKPRHLPHDYQHSSTTSSLDEKSKPAFTLPRWATTLLSVFAVVHVIAVYAEPFRFSTQAESPAPADDALLIRNALKPYIDMMYLNHGYYFFAPNPGPSHLVVCVFNDVDFSSKPNTAEDINNHLERIVYPDKAIQKPRLLYHRYFMYTEFYHTLFTPNDLPENANDGAPMPPELKRGKALYAALGQSLEKYFNVRYPERRFQIFRVEHGLPTARQVLDEGMKLDDPRLYVELPESYTPPIMQMPPIAPALIELGVPQTGAVRP